MATIGRWNNHKFVVSSKSILSFRDLKIKSSSETEDKTSDNQKYVQRKNGKPTEITLTVVLNQAFKKNVKKQAMAFLDDAQAGKTDYFYVGTSKLVSCKLMLTDASIEGVELSPKKMEWISASVALTFKQATKSDGTTGGSDGGSGSSKKKSTKRTGTTTTQKTTYDPTRTEGKSGHTSVPTRFQKKETAYTVIKRGIEHLITVARKQTLSSTRKKGGGGTNYSMQR